MELRFRAAGSSDIPQLVRLRLAYFEEESGMMDVQTYAQLTEQLHAYFEAHLGEDCLVNVAEAADGLLVSVVILTCVAQPPNLCVPNGRKGMVYGVYTMPQYRKQGCAGTLMRMLLDDAKAQRLDVVYLSATEMGKPIYEALGFRLHESDYTNMEYVLATS